MLGAMSHDLLTAQTAGIFPEGTVTFLFTDASFEAGRAAGRLLSLEQAVEDVLSDA
jgi:hypothetical protein